MRIMFFHFSLNILQPVQLVEKLSVMQTDQDLLAWITDYLIQTTVCQAVILPVNTGTPQGTALSLFLFTLYTSGFCYNSQTFHLQRFSDDSFIVRCITDNEEGTNGELCTMVWQVPPSAQLGGIGSSGIINKLVRKVSSVTGMKLDSVEAVTERMRGRLQTIIDNPSHLLYAELRQLRIPLSHTHQTTCHKALGGALSYHQ